MNLPVQVDQKQLMDILLNVGTVRPVFIWGAPGIGKSAIVEQFAKDIEDVLLAQIEKEMSI